MRSEHLYRAILENMSEQVYVCDRDKNLLYFNQAVERLTGWTWPAASGKKCYEVFGDEDLICRRVCPVDKATTEGLPGLHHEGKLETRSGEVQDMQVSISPLREGETIVGAIVVVQDVTRLGEVEHAHVQTLIALEKEMERQEAIERALRESEREKALILSSVLELVTYQDPALRIIWANRAAGESVGLLGDELVGRFCYEIWHQRSEPCGDCPVVNALETGVPQEGGVVTPDGRVWSIKGYPIQDERGDIVGAVEVTREITEQRRAEEELLQQAGILAALHETALDLATQQELPNLLQAIVSRAVDLLDAKGGGVYLYRPTSDDLEYVCTYKVAGTSVGTVLQRGEGLSGKALESGRPLRVDDYNHWEGRSPQFEGVGLNACVAVPIRWGDRILGVLNVDHDPPRTFSADDIAVLERFVVLAAAALEQTRLLEEARSRWREAETLRQAGAAVNEVLSLDERLERILEQLGRVVPYDSASVQLLRDDCLEIVGGRGFPEPEEVLGLRFPVPGDNPNTAVFERQEAVILSDARAAHPPFREPPHDHIRSWLGVPMIVHDRVIGILAVDSMELGHFNEEHVRLVIPFADQVAVALENARLYSDLQQQMEELKSTQAQLVQSAKLAAVGELAAGVAHELNNPLTSVLGFAEIVAEEAGPDYSLREELGIIISESRRARDIVRALLDFARQSKPLREPTDVNEILRQTLVVIRHHVEKSGVTIEEAYAADLGSLLLDEGQIKQVLLNLISNAAHATPEGGTLYLRTARIGDEVAISVADTGAGIPLENLDRIFDPFFSTKPSGTGLGLSVSLGIVQEHGGRITVESKEGQGSTFTVWLPVEAPV